MDSAIEGGGREGGVRFAAGGGRDGGEGVSRGEVVGGSRSSLDDDEFGLISEATWFARAVSSPKDEMEEVRFLAAELSLNFDVDFSLVGDRFLNTTPSEFCLLSNVDFCESAVDFSRRLEACRASIVALSCDARSAAA